MYSQQQWQEASYRYLESEIAKIQDFLREMYGKDDSPSAPSPANLTEAPEVDQSILALDHLCASFELSKEERILLILCAGWELKKTLSGLYCEFLEKPVPSFPTLDLIQKLIPALDDRLLSPEGPLHLYSLLEPGSTEDGLRDNPLKLKRWVLYFLMGYPSYQDPYLPATLNPKSLSASAHPLPASYNLLLEAIQQQWDATDAPSLTQLCGPDPKAHQFIAAEIAKRYGHQLVHLNAANLPTDPNIRRYWLTQWKSRAVLDSQALLIEFNAQTAQHPALLETLSQIDADKTVPLFLSLGDRLQQYSDSLSLDVPELTLTEQKQQWAYHLGTYAPQLNGHIGKIVAQFNVTLHNVQTVSKRAIVQIEKPRPDGTSPKPLPELVWQICRTEARSRLEGLVERIEPKTTWDDLILPPEAQMILKEIIATGSDRAEVYDEWGMGGGTDRGMGIISLFYGPSGTGKTTAAEIIASELHLDLYLINLSQVSSKYIGETEKNLEQVFGSAQQSGAVLLFDEADSLVGKRGEVKDARDQYANQTVSYLLQAMERYSGLAILTTNLPNAIDPAFDRRIHYKIRFEYPTQEQRVMIWAKNFPATAPTLDLSYPRLAKAILSGAMIRKAAINAGFIAKRQGEPIQMKHVHQAILTQCIGQGRSLTDDETRGWGVK
jgi:ATPase family associated with various cellular activities (AAA)